MNEQELDQLLQAAEELENDIKFLTRISVLEGEGIEVDYAVDFSEVYRYLHPFHTLPRDMLDLERLLVEQFSLTALFEAARTPLVLLPPYQLELENHLATRHKRLFDAGLEALAAARHMLARDLDKLKDTACVVRAMDAAAVLETVEPALYLSPEYEMHSNAIIEFASRHFDGLLRLMLLEAACTPGFVQKRFDRLMEQGLRPIPGDLTGTVNDRTLESICAAPQTYVFARKFDDRRANSYANKIDAVAGNLVLEVNGSQAYRNRALVLVTHARLMHELLGPELTRTLELRDDGMLELPLLMHPSCVSTRLLHEQGDKLRENLERTWQWVTALKSCANLRSVPKELEDEAAIRLENSLETVMDRARSELLPRLKTLANITAMVASRPALTAVLSQVRKGAGDMMDLGMDVLKFCQAPDMALEMLSRMEETAEVLLNSWRGLEPALVERVAAKFGQADVWRQIGELFKTSSPSLRLAPNDEDLYPYQFCRFKTQQLNRTALETVSGQISWTGVRNTVGRRIPEILRAAASAPAGERTLFIAFLSLLSNPEVGLKQIGKMISEGIDLARADSDEDLEAEFRFLSSIVSRLGTHYQAALDSCNEALKIHPADARFLKEAAVLKWRLSETCRMSGKDEEAHKLRLNSLADTRAALEAVEPIGDANLKAQLLMNLAYMQLEIYRRSEADEHRLREAAETIGSMEHSCPDETKWYAEMRFTRGSVQFEMLKRGMLDKEDVSIKERIRTDLLKAELGAISSSDREEARSLILKLDAMLTKPGKP